MKIIKGLSAALLAIGLIGCNGGGSGGVSTGGVFFSHSQLANEFVRRLNIDAGYDVDLVKTNTEQFDYIVVYDYDLDSYDAYYIGAYNPGENLSRYLDLYDSRFYYDLDDIGANRYEDFFTGLIFNKGQAKSKDMLKAKAIAEAIRINKSAAILEADFGVSTAKSRAFAAALMHLNKKQARFGLSKADVNGVMGEFLGTSVEEVNEALSSYASDQSKANKIFAKGADLMETTPEQLSDGLIDMLTPKKK